MATSTRESVGTSSSYQGPYAALVNKAARDNGLDPWWLAAILKVESGFRPVATSSAGAQGIAQIHLPSHPNISKAQAETPSFAIPWAARYLAALRKQHNGSLEQATISYNTGPAASASVRASAGIHYLDQVKAAWRDLRKQVFGPPVQNVLSAARPDVDLNRVDPGLLGRLYAVAVATGKKISVFSGYRPPGSPYGYANDPHQRGVAVDATVDGKPIGEVIPLATLAKFGLEGGNVPGFYPAGGGDGRDPEHVQLPGAGVNKKLTSSSSGGSWIGNVSGWLKKGAGADLLLGIPVVGPIAAAAALGVPGVDKIPGVNTVTNAVDDVKAVGHLANLFIDDPAYPFLWLLFMVLGFALVFLGVTRLVDVQPQPAMFPPGGAA